MKKKVILSMKEALILACTAPLLFLTDIFCYVILHENKSIIDTSFKNIMMWILYIFIFIFIFLVMICLFYTLAVAKRNYQIGLTVAGLINLISVWCQNDIKKINWELIAVIIWIGTDIVISFFISKKIGELKIGSIFKTVEVTETYHKYGKEIKKCEKTYPVLLPIIVAIISASGAIIASVITKR
ncbi:hypothetical protein [Lactobacillus johnsonii]|uniref:hypothetical protein n=1 Tax=Lactobacillus johnsonii TaxID=33959 RepID=UPI001F592C3E|nr:hypothetical protein [Lactobacillus johnsonii]UNL59716.1 hypothetical protein G8B18_02980 [Lactobacillus johnsonii]